jgi:hypothetical protein
VPSTTDAVADGTPSLVSGKLDYTPAETATL